MCSERHFAILLALPLMASVALAAEGKIILSKVLEIGLPQDTHQDLSAPDDYCEVKTLLTLDYSGNVSEVRIIESNPPGLCDSEAVEHAKKSRFPDSGPGYQELVVRIANR